MKGEAKESDAQPAGPAAQKMKAAEAWGDPEQKDEEAKRKDEAATQVREDKENHPQAVASDPQAKEAKEREATEIDPQAAVGHPQAAVSDPQAEEAKEREATEIDPQAAVGHPQAAVSDPQAEEAKEREATEIDPRAAVGHPQAAASDPQAKEAKVPHAADENRRVGATACLYIY